MSDINKFTTKEVLNKVLLDSSGNAVNAFSHTTQEAFNAALDDDNSRLNVNLVGGTIGGDVTINGDLTVNGDGVGAYDEIINGQLEVRGDATDSATGMTGFLTLSTAFTDINATDQLGRINFQAPLEAGGTDAILAGASIYGIAEATFANNNNSTGIAFATATSSVPIERMRIDSSGNIGIGTTSPAAPLVIQTTNTLGLDSAPTGSVSIGSPSSTPQGAVLGRQTANAVALNIMAAGVDGNTNGDMIFNTRENNNSGFATLTNSAFKFQHYTTDLVNILRNGNTTFAGDVMINSSSANYADLTVGGTGDIVALRASSGTAGFTMYEAGTGRFNMTTLNGSNGIAFKVPSTTALTLDSSANATFGGDIQANERITFTDTNNSIASNTLTRHSNGYLYIAGGSSGLVVGNSDASVRTQYMGATMQFETESVVRFKLDSNSRISLSNNDNNTSNTVFGKSAFNAGSDNSSDFNTVFGELVMGTGTVNGADNNSGFGYKAIQEITSASNNTAVGFRAGTSITTGDGNVIMGSTAGDAITTESNCTLIGQFAGSGINSTDANGSTAVGNTALWKNTSGQRNNALGFQSLAQNTTGDDNIAIGYQSLTASAESQAHRNIAIGSYALSTLNARGQNNIAIGFEALETANHADVDVNIAIGNYVLDDVGGAGVWACVGIGHNALTSVNHAGAVGSTAIGYYSLSSLTSGAGNTAVGFEALKTISSGTTSTAVGYEALELATGNSNTAIGYEAGNIISTGTECTILGGFSNPSANNASNETVVGSGITGNGSNSVTLGNTSVTAVYMAKDSGAVVHASGLKFDNDQTNNIDEANTLDDYEEGTYTPSITGSSSGNYVLNTSYDSTSYTKIGRQVTMTGEIRVASDNSASGTIRVSIPFAVAQLTDTAGVSISNIFVSGHGDADIDSNKLLIYLDEGTQYFTIFEVNDDDSTVVLTDSHFDTAFNLTFTFTYFTS